MATAVGRCAFHGDRGNDAEGVAAAVETSTVGLDVVEALHKLRAALEPELQQLVQRKAATRVSSAQYVRTHGHINHLQRLTLEEQKHFEALGCDFGMLYDIKLFFDEERAGHSRPGLPEREFLEVVAPIFCPTFPTKLSSWFNTIDSDGSGYVDWQKMSSHLLGICASNANTLHASSSLAAAGFSEAPRGRLAANPGYRILRMISNRVTRSSFFAVCSEGHVREYDTQLLKSSAIVHHADGTTVLDAKFLPERNQLFVADSAGLILIYDAGGTCTRTGTIVKAMRVARHGPADPIEQLRKTVKFDPLRMIESGTATFDPKMTSCDVAVEVTPLRGRQRCVCHPGVPCKCSHSQLNLLGNAVRCIEPWYDPDNKNPVFVTGHERGLLALHTPDLLSHAPAAPVAVWQPHHSWVTKLAIHTRHPELRGLISASDDASLAFSDLERCETYATIVDRKGRGEAGDGGGWVGGARPITCFDVAEWAPMIVTSGNMRTVTFWAGDTRKKIAALHDHKANVIDVAFCGFTQQAVSLGEDRTIRIWDTRMFRVVQIISERDHLASMLVSDAPTRSILAACGTPLQFPLLDADDPTAAAALPEQQSATVVSVARNPSLRQIITCDGSSLTAWDEADGATCFRVPVPRQVLAWTMDTMCSKLIIADGSGSILVVLYGSSKPARTFQLAPTAPPASLLHLEVPELPPMIVGGMRDGTLLFFADKTITSTLPLLHGVALDAAARERHAADAKQDLLVDTGEHRGIAPTVTSCGAVTLLAHIRVNHIAVGTASGSVALISVHPSGPSVYFMSTLDRCIASVNVRSGRFGSSVGGGGGAGVGVSARAGAGAGGGGSRSATPSSTAHLWRHLLEVTKRERALSASTFTRFRHDAAMLMKRECESLLLCSSSGHLLATFGNGEGLLLKITGKEVATLGLVPLSSGGGYACVATFHSSSGRLFVADDAGVLSTFTLDPSKHCATAKAGTRYFMAAHLRLIAAVRVPSSVIDLVAISARLVALVVEAPRPLVVDVETECVLWGPRLSLASVRSHRFVSLLPALCAPRLAEGLSQREQDGAAAGQHAHAPRGSGSTPLPSPVAAAKVVAARGAGRPLLHETHAAPAGVARPMTPQLLGSEATADERLRRLTDKLAARPIRASSAMQFRPDGQLAPLGDDIGSTTASRQPQPQPQPGFQHSQTAIQVARVLRRGRERALPDADLWYRRLRVNAPLPLESPIERLAGRGEGEGAAAGNGGGAAQQQRRRLR